MHVSFDIDDTLICCQPGAVHEPNRVPRFLRPWFNEPLRLGAVALMHELTRQGHVLSVYTTSYRSPNYLRLWLRCYGIRVSEVVNQRRHEQVVKPESFRRWPSKYPPAFGIDVHVDDSEGVGMEGREHGFRTVVVSVNDPDWARHVLEGVKAKAPAE